jgi:ADP-heptose:LPS heptosyltransferase
MQRILVIKLGALGDFAHAFHAFAAIRAHHAGDHLTLLTTPPFAALAEMMPWFDAVRLDRRPPWWNLRELRRTARALRGFDFVYDLQTSRRSGRYFRLAGRPPWSGIAPGCSHPHANPGRDRMHTIERQREQLEMAGIAEFPAPDLDWLPRQGRTHGLTQPYALLMPGGAGVGSVKRWPAENYAQLAAALAERGLTPAIIGGPAEAGLAAAIRRSCPTAIDLTGRTSIPDIAALAAGAVLVVGNDTGPLHLAAKTGVRTIVLFSKAGVPAEAAPRGPRGEWATVIQESHLANLSVERVLAAIEGSGGTS